MRNRKIGAPSPSETIIDIDELIRSTRFNLADLPIEVLVHIFSLCDVQDIIAISQTHWLFFAIVVSMNPKQLGLMNLYRYQMDLLHEHTPLMLLQFNLLAAYNIPMLIRQCEEKNHLDASFLKVLNFIVMIRNINQECSRYEAIDREEWSDKAQQLKMHMMFLKATLAIGLTYVMSSYFDSLLLIFLGMAAALVILAKDLFNHMANQKQLWDAQRKIGTKVLRQFSLFIETNKKPNELTTGVLLGVEQEGGVWQYLAQRNKIE